MSNMTELVFILDRSGSMGGLESDTVGGFNAMLSKQKKEDGECRITTILFDNEYEILHDRIDIMAVRPITESEYFVRGQTALLDAIGKTINKINSVQKNTADEYRADKVLFIITTDGMENASREYTFESIKGLIERQKSECGWEFIFLGANIDAAEVANSIGIDREYSKSFHNDKEGIALNYEAVSEAAASFRSSGKGERLFKGWGTRIDNDFENRKK